MNTSPVDRQGGFLDRFSQSGVGMRAPRQVFTAVPKSNRSRRFGNQVSGARADDVHAQDAIGLPVGQYFGFSFGPAQRQGAAIRAKRKDSLAKGDLRLRHFFLGFSDGSNFRLRID